MLTNESKENEASSSSVMGGQAVFVIQENGQLKNLVLLNNVDSFKNVSRD